MRRFWLALPLIVVACVAQAASHQNRTRPPDKDVSLVTKVKNWIAAKFASTDGTTADRAKQRTRAPLAASSSKRAPVTTDRLAPSMTTSAGSKLASVHATTAVHATTRPGAPLATSSSKRAPTTTDRLALLTTTSDLPALRSSRDDGCSGQRIIAAYYWQGSETASGQRFNPHGLTAAHRTLPFGTQLTVSNPRTRKSVDVVVNDRGPFVRGVSLDLSLGAAKAIGMTGTGPVCIR